MILLKYNMKGQTISIFISYMYEYVLVRNRQKLSLAEVLHWRHVLLDLDVWHNTASVRLCLWVVFELAIEALLWPVMERQSARASWLLSVKSSAPNLSLILRTTLAKEMFAVVVVDEHAYQRRAVAASSSSLPEIVLHAHYALVQRALHRQPRQAGRVNVSRDPASPESSSGFLFVDAKDTLLWDCPVLLCNLRVLLEGLRRQRVSVRFLRFRRQRGESHSRSNIWWFGRALGSRRSGPGGDVDSPSVNFWAGEKQVEEARIPCGGCFS